MKQKNDPTKKPKKRVRRDRTEEILQVTTRLFGEYGFQGTTLAMIAEEVGLTEPGILHYFPNKVSLLQGVLEYQDQKDMDKFSVLLETEKKDITELFKMLKDVFMENERSPELIQLFIVLAGESLRKEHPSHDFFVDHYRRAREMYVKQFLTLNKTKIRSDVDLEQLASMSNALVDGLYIQWLLDPENVNLEATYELFAKMMIGYLES